MANAISQKMVQFSRKLLISIEMQSFQFPFTLPILAPHLAFNVFEGRKKVVIGINQ